MFFEKAFLISFNSSSGFALSNLSRFLVKFSTVDFSQGAGLFACALEPAQRNVKWFVISYFYRGHRVSVPFFTVMGKNGEF
jgi:hypothetical protein